MTDRPRITPAPPALPRVPSPRDPVVPESPGATAGFVAGLLTSPPVQAGAWLWETVRELQMDSEPGYSEFDDPQIQGFEDYMPFLIGARSREQMANRIERLRKRIRLAEISSQHPVAAMVGYMTDPSLLLPLGVAHGAGALRGAVRGGLSTGGVVLATEGSRQITDPLADPHDLLAATTAAVVLGVPVGAWIGRVPKTAAAMRAAEGIPDPAPTVEAGVETVLEAAVRLPDGAVHTGRAHDDIAVALEDAGIDMAGAESGFVTSTGRFVDRREAAVLAGRGAPDKGLQSEDLDELPERAEALPDEPFWLSADEFRDVPDRRARLSDTLGTFAANRLGIKSLADHEATQGMRPQGAFGFEYGSFSPVMRRLLRTHSEVTGETILKMTTPRWLLRQHFEGVPSPPSIANALAQHHVPYFEALKGVDKAYLAYRGVEAGKLPRLRAVGLTLRTRADRVLGRGGAEMSYGEFREEVGKAMHLGDRHPNVHVVEAAKRMRQVAADLDVEAGKTGVWRTGGSPIGKPGNAAGYFPVIWRHDRVRAGRVEMERRLAGDLARAGRAGDPAKLVDDILRGDAFETPAGPDAGGPSMAAHARKLDFIDPKDYFDFLETDVDVGMRHLVRSLSADIELTRAFGDPMMTNTIKRIEGSYGGMISHNPARRVELEKARDADLAAVRGLRDAIRGTLGRPEAPDALSTRVIQALRSYNVLTFLGGAAVSAMVDFVRPVMTEGVQRTIGAAWTVFSAGLDTIKMAKREAQLSGTAWDLTTAQRGALLANAGDTFGKSTKWERLLHNAAQSFSVINLLAFETVAAKSFAGLVIQTRIIDDAIQFVAGKLGKKGVRKLARGGIGPEMAKRIAEQAQRWGSKHKGVGGGHVWLPNTEAWTDELAVRDFRSALYNDIDRTITTPGLGDLPLWASSETGKLVLQFRSFTLTNYQTLLVAGLQERDAAALAGVFSMIAMGAVVDRLKELQWDEARPISLEARLTNAIDRSGITSWLFDVNNMVERLTDETVGLRPMLGQDPAGPDYSTLGERLQKTAPFAAQLGNAGALLANALSGDLERRDAIRLRKILAYNQVFWLQSLFDELEDALKGAGKAPPKRLGNSS